MLTDVGLLKVGGSLAGGRQPTRYRVVVVTDGLSNKQHASLASAARSSLDRAGQDPPRQSLPSLVGGEPQDGLLLDGDADRGSLAQAESKVFPALAGDEVDAGRSLLHVEDDLAVDREARVDVVAKHAAGVDIIEHGRGHRVVQCSPSRG